MAGRKIFIIYIVFICLAVTPSGKSDNVDTQFGYAELANKVNDFGYKLIVQMMKKNNIYANVIISPTAVFGLLAMTLLGSAGRSYDELADKLGFSQDVLLNRKTHEQLGNLLKDLNANDTSSQTMYADAIFVDRSSKLRQVYQSYLTKVYNGYALSADFRDSSKVRSLINEWVSNNTNGKIMEFLKEDLSTETKVALLSALYFAGTWAQPFPPEYTKKMPFTTPAGEVQADLMLNSGYFKYAISMEHGFEVMAFPYKNNITTLYAVKSKFPKLTSITELMNTIDFAKINDLIHKMETKQSVIRFPKMDLNTESKLQQSLKALGIQSMFTPGEANFALMIDSDSNNNNTTEEEIIERINESNKEKDRDVRQLIDKLPNPGVHVDSVIHSVKIKINEYGTEAAAVAGGFLARTAQQFYLNAPFYMFIRNEKTNLITFSAVIFDPNL